MDTQDKDLKKIHTSIQEFMVEKRRKQEELQNQRRSDYRNEKFGGLSEEEIIACLKENYPEKFI